jgi:hypothetical protein
VPFLGGAPSTRSTPSFLATPKPPPLSPSSSQLLFSRTYIFVKIILFSVIRSRS